MASQAHLEKMEVRQNYRNLWHTDLMSTIQVDTPCLRELQIAALLCGVGLVSHICFVNVLFTMTCQDMFAVLVICLVVEGAVKVGVPNFALPLRYSSALEIQWPLPASCYKMNSIFRQLNVTIALLYSLSLSIWSVCVFGYQRVPPSVGYPPQPSYGQPYGNGYPPPRAQGYPAAGYPVSQYPPPPNPPPGYK